MTCQTRMLHPPDSFQHVACADADGEAMQHGKLWLGHRPQHA